MPITKNSRTLLISQTLAPGASINTAELNLSTAPGARVFVRITNGASAPTTPPSVIFYTGEATGVKREIHRAQGDVAASSVKDIPCRFSLPDMFVNATITAGATNGCTVEAYAQEATTI